MDRPKNNAYIYADEALALLRGSHFACKKQRITFFLPDGALSICKFKREFNGRAIVQKDHIAICLEIQDLPPATDFQAPDYHSRVAN